MIEKTTPDLLTLLTTFYEVSVSFNRFSKTEMRQFGASGTDGLTNIFFIYREPEVPRRRTSSGNSIQLMKTTGTCTEDSVEDFQYEVLN